MELLIGCGNRRARKVGGEWTELVTLDHDPNCGADVVHDLESLPWPFDDGTFDEVHAYQVLEHLGRQGDYKSFFALFAEIWRVLKPEGVLYAEVPSIHSRWAWGDPSHTRVYQKEHLIFLDQWNYQNEVGKTSMTDFRWIWRGDFECLAAQDDGADFRFALLAHKPARYIDGAQTKD
jgi:SAM-dependent methyltransferase